MSFGCARKLAEFRFYKLLRGSVGQLIDTCVQGRPIVMTYRRNSIEHKNVELSVPIVLCQLLHKSCRGKG
jgi:hypothetical protein